MHDKLTFFVQRLKDRGMACSKFCYYVSGILTFPLIIIGHVFICIGHCIKCLERTLEKWLKG